MGQSWMRFLRAWVQGQKHPDTPRVVFMNVWEQDRVRRILTARCKICGYVVSRDEKSVKEILYQCQDKSCDCYKTTVPRSTMHQVCDVCDAMFRSLYVNYSMVNMNYFKEIDEKEKRDGDDFKRRDRMGL